MSETQEMQSIQIIDESVVTRIRDAGYTCEREVYTNSNALSPWYRTDCPLEHCRPIAGVICVGAVAMKVEDYPQFQGQLELKFLRTPDVLPMNVTKEQ